MQTPRWFLSALIGLVAINASSANASYSSDHLVPLDGLLTVYGPHYSYLETVRTVLVGDVCEHSSAAMVTLPSFSGESIVYLQEKNDGVFVVSARVSKQIWSASKDDKITVIRSEKPIDAKLAKQLGSVFALAVSQTRYPEHETLGLDGVDYQFSAFARFYGTRAGKTWSPDRQTACGKLVALGEHMQGYVTGEITAEELEAEARELVTILRKMRRN